MGPVWPSFIVITGGNKKKKDTTQKKEHIADTTIFPQKSAKSNLNKVFRSDFKLAPCFMRTAVVSILFYDTYLFVVN